MIIKELPLSILLDSIFSDNDMLSECKIVKCFPGPDFRPEKIHKALGELLKALDSDEVLVHIDIYPTHAQILRRSVWDESNEKRYRGSAASEKRTIEIEKRNQKLSELVKALSEVSGFPPDQCMKEAMSIFKNKNKVIANVLGVQL